MPSLAEIRYYPFKSLSGLQLDAAELTEGQGLPDDRRYGLSRVEDMEAHLATDWQPWKTCHTLKEGGMLARLKLHGEPGSPQMRLSCGNDSVDVDLGTAQGRGEFADFINNAVGIEATVADSRHMPLWDYGLRSPVSLLSRASIDAFAGGIGVELDPQRFRGNLLIDGMQPWEEQQWTPGSRVRIGAVEFEVLMQIKRCAATRINPDTAANDVNVPAEMHRSLGHNICGIGLKVVAGGTISQGDSVALPAQT